MSRHACLALLTLSLCAPAPCGGGRARRGGLGGCGFLGGSRAQLDATTRTDEPGGWLELARAQIAGGKKEAARKTLKEVLARTWEQRFGDVHSQAAQLLKSLD